MTLEEKTELPHVQTIDDLKRNLLPTLQSGKFDASKWLASNNDFIYRPNLLVTLRQSKQLEVYFGEECLGLIEPPLELKEVVKVSDQTESLALAEAFRTSKGVREVGPGVYAVRTDNLGVGAGVGTTGGNAGVSLQGLQGRAEQGGPDQSSKDAEQRSKIRDFVDGFKRFAGSALLFRKVDPEAMSGASTAKLCGFLFAFVIFAATTLITMGYIFSIMVADQRKSVEVELKGR